MLIRRTIVEGFTPAFEATVRIECKGISAGLSITYLAAFFTSFEKPTYPLDSFWLISVVEKLFEFIQEYSTINMTI